MQQPDLASLWTQAVDHFQHDRHPQAHALCLQLIRHAPDKPLACGMLAKMAFAAGVMREATAHALEASRRLLGVPAGDIIEAAHVLLEVGETHLAHAVLGLVDPAHPDNAGLLVDLGRVYSALED